MCVDVILPCVQIDQSLIKSLRSLERQTFTNIKVYLVINSKEILAETETISKILDDFLNLKIITVDGTLKKGAWFARNIGISNSNSRFVAFLDCGDEFYQDHIADALDLLVASDADIYYCSYLNQNVNKVWHEFRRCDMKLTLFDLVTLCPIGTSTVVLKRDVNPEFPAIMLRHDLACWGKLFLERYSFVNNPKVNVQRNVLNNSLSSKKYKTLKYYYYVYINVFGARLTTILYWFAALLLRHFLRVFRRRSGYPQF